MRIAGFAIAAAVLSLTGCGKAPTNREPVYPIGGKIVYKGQPVKGADVTFFCKEKDRSAFGRTDDDGTFKLTTFSTNDGAIAGKHTVVVSKTETPPPTKPEAPITSADYQPPQPGDDRATKPKKLLPVKYADPKTSDLIAIVNADGNNPEVTFELKD